MNDLQAQAERVVALDLQQVRSFLDDPECQEVMINSPKVVFVERQGRFERVDVSFSAAALESAITTLCNINSKSKQMVLDCRLPGLRIAATLPPIAVHGPSMSIRRHSSRLFTLEDYLAQGAFRPSAPGRAADGGQDLQDLAAGDLAVPKFLRWLVRSRVNFLVTGSTSSGKTAFLNCLAQFLPDEQRIVTIEDTSELQIRVPNWLAFEANTAHGIDVRMLVRHALRNRPHRIWVGEGRGAEFYDILDAYNTGHPGSTVTFHSDSAGMALARLENMVRMAPEAANWPLADLRRQIAGTFRFVIHCSNEAGIRGPSEILAVDGVADGQYITRSLFRRAFD